MRELLTPTCDEDAAYYGTTYPEMPPRIHRDGLYFDRRTNTSWAEVQGRAFRMDARQTQYTFDVLQVARYSTRQVAALRELVAQGMATAAQRALYHRMADYHRDRLFFRQTAARGVMAHRRMRAALAARRAAAAAGGTA